MLAAIPLVAFALLVAVLLSRGNRRGSLSSLREALVIAAVLWGALVVAATELLSLPRWFSFGPVLACWLGVILLVVAVGRTSFRDFRLTLPALALHEWALLTLGLLLLLATGLCSVLGPPNNFDSQWYVLPRQVHWLQQGSVAHFPTPWIPQLVWPPFAEFVQVHLTLLAGSDRWVNLPQWFALVLTLVAVSLLARDLEMNRTGQLLAAFFALTVPMAYLQAFNTKNELWVSLWLCTAAWLVLRPRAALSLPSSSLLLGLALGLLALTKGTGYLFSLPVVVVWAGRILLQERRAWRHAGLVVLLPLLINAGHWTRNYQVFHCVVAPAETQRLHNNETHTWKSVASNVLRNLAIQLASPSARWNENVQTLVNRCHRAMRISPEDSRTTFCALPFLVAFDPRSEDLAPAPVHVALALLTTALLPLWLPRRVGGLRRLVLVGLPYAGFFLFCFIVKWQPWHMRLHVPLLCLFSVALALFFQGKYMKWAAPVAAGELPARAGPPGRVLPVEVAVWEIERFLHE